MTEEQKKKILIIEDEALVARELRSRLTNMGYAARRQLASDAKRLIGDTGPLQVGLGSLGDATRVLRDPHARLGIADVRQHAERG